MKQLTLRIVWGVVSVILYLLLIFSLFFYFNHRNHETKKHYVKKDEHRIQVAIAAAPKAPAVKKKKAVKPKPKPAPKKKQKEKKTQPHKKKVLKEKITKKRIKKRDRNTTRPKKRPKDLFSQVKAKKTKPLIRVTDKPIIRTPKKKLFEMVDAKPSKNYRPDHSLKEQKQRDSGVEDAYLAHVQEMLEGWPAQSDFAGEKVKVHLKIDPTGHFEFIIKRRSQNPAFNRALTDYLKQLQAFGFGPHRGSRTYLFEAEFIAKE
jgi:protein TonB